MGLRNNRQLDRFGASQRQVSKYDYYLHFKMWKHCLREVE